MIAGIVCGSIMAIGYFIGFTVYFIKRIKRKNRKRAVEAGRKKPKPPKVSEKAAEPVVIPPDPAVLFGQRQAGEHAFPDKHKDSPKEDKLPHFHPPSFHRHHSNKLGNGGVPTQNNDSNQTVNQERFHTPDDSPVTRPLLPSKEVIEKEAGS